MHQWGFTSVSWMALIAVLDRQDFPFTGLPQEVRLDLAAFRAMADELNAVALDMKSGG
jgi:hypothetical protein